MCLCVTEVSFKTKTDSCWNIIWKFIVLWKIQLVKENLSNVLWGISKNSLLSVKGIEKCFSQMLFLSFQWPWHLRRYINSWNEAIHLMNMSVSNVCARLLVWATCTGVKWTHGHKMMLEVMSVKVNTWQPVGLFNFTHHSTINGVHLPHIRKIFWLVKLDMKQWDSGRWELVFGDLTRHACAAKQTITHW